MSPADHVTKLRSSPDGFLGKNPDEAHSNLVGWEHTFTTFKVYLPVYLSASSQFNDDMIYFRRTWPAFIRLRQHKGSLWYWLSLILTSDGKKRPQNNSIILCRLRFSSGVVGHQQTNRKRYILVICGFPPMDEFQGKAICSWHSRPLLFTRSQPGPSSLSNPTERPCCEDIRQKNNI